MRHQHAPPRKLVPLIVCALLAATTLFGLGCSSAGATSMLPNDAAEAQDHWTDSQNHNAVTFDFGDLARFQEQRSDGGDAAVEEVIDDEADLAALHAAGGSPVVILRDITIEIWNDTASSAQRDGSGSTQSGDVGAVNQSPTQETDANVEVDPGLSP